MTKKKKKKKSNSMLRRGESEKLLMKGDCFSHLGRQTVKRYFWVLVHIYLYTLAISPSLGGSRQHKRTTKTMGTPLRSSSNDEGPSQVWMALLEQHSPSSPIFHNLRRFTDAISPMPLPQGCPYKATLWQRQMPIRTVSQSFATHSYS